MGCICTYMKRLCISEIEPTINAVDAVKIEEFKKKIIDNCINNKKSS